MEARGEEKDKAKGEVVMAKKIEYWAMHWFGTYQVCSSHKTLKAAIEAAQECEARGGSPHDIWKCEKQPRPKPKLAKNKWRSEGRRKS